MGTANQHSPTLEQAITAQGRERKRDFYATSPFAVECLLKVERFNKQVWECACGKGHISFVLKAHGYEVRESDIEDRMGNEVVDFLQSDSKEQEADIITNPPYSHAQEFIEKALSIVRNGGKVAMFLKLQFLEGQKRRKLYEQHPPKIVYVFSKRVGCAINGEFEQYKNRGNAIAYAWYVWEKGYRGETVIKWIN